MENVQNDEESQNEFHTSKRPEACESFTSGASAQSRDIGEDLETIGENMGQMATILQQIYGEQRSSKSPTGKKRARSQSPPTLANSSTKAKTAKSSTRDDPDHSSRQIDDDQVSLYASGNEQDDLHQDVLLLTGQNKAVNDQPDSGLLRDLANELDEDEPPGESVR